VARSNSCFVAEKSIALNFNQTILESVPGCQVVSMVRDAPKASLTPWQQFSVTVPQPALNATSVGSGIGGEVLNLSRLGTISDPGFVGYEQLELWDSKGTLAGGQFVVNGMRSTFRRECCEHRVRRWAGRIPRPKKSMN
jgi:hypothetical protein